MAIDRCCKVGEDEEMFGVSQCPVMVSPRRTHEQEVMEIFSLPAPLKPSNSFFPLWLFLHNYFVTACVSAGVCF